MITSTIVGALPIASASVENAVNLLIGKVLTFALWVASKLPRRHTVRIAKMLATLAGPTELGSVTRTNLRACYPHLDEEALRARVRESLTQMSLMFFEFAQLRYWPYDKITNGVRFTNEGLLRDAAQSDSGVLLLVPHLSLIHI